MGFATQVIYGYLSMPFILFKIPVLTVVLTHAVATGYDRQGRCRQYTGRPPMKKDKTNFLGQEFVTMDEANKLLNKVKTLFIKGKADLDSADDASSKDAAATCTAPIVLGAVLSADE